MVKKICIFIMVSFLLGAPALVFADMPAPTKPTTNNAANCPEGRQCLESPLSGKIEVTSLVGTIIKAVLGLIGSITLFMLVWGGFQWLTSAGNQEKVSQGTQTMLWAVIGLGVVFGSYIFLTTYIQFLTGSK
jgi:hypothetical protein